MRPKKIHFITGLNKNFGGKPFIFANLLAVLSANRAYPDHELIVHLQYEPYGACWAIARKFVTVSEVVAPKEIFGNPIEHFAHAADVLRLQILIEQGGIYFDMDTLVLRPIEGLPEDKVVMGIEAHDDNSAAGLCNAFIAAPPEAPFLVRWLERYRTFDGRVWNDHSVRLPLQLWQEFPESIHVESRRAFFYPMWTEESLKDLFERCVDVSTSYSIHLWESRSWRYLSVVDPASIRDGGSTFNVQATQVLESFSSDLCAGIKCDDFIHDEIRSQFNEVYKTNLWGGGSGSGSRYENNIEYVAFLSRFMERNGVKTVVDLGCGDWQFSKYINWNGVTYLGLDASESVVKRNSSLFASEAIIFSLFTNFREIEAADLLICKDVMQHWPNKIVNDALDILSAKFKYLLITNDEEPIAGQNRDIELAGWRPIDIRKSPFNRNAAVVLSWYVYDGSLVRKSTMIMFGS